MGYLTISKSNGWLTIQATEKGFRYPSCRYLWYSKREAIKKYRQENNLKYKRLEEVII